MKGLIAFIVLMVGHWALSQFTPWWNLAFVALIVMFFARLGTLKSFWYAFCAILIQWIMLIGAIDFRNEGLLSTQLAQMLGLGSKWLIILLSSLLGALIAGFSGAAGNIFAEIFKKTEIQLAENEEPMYIEELKDLRPDWKDSDHI